MLRMRNVSDQRHRENLNSHFYAKSCRVLANVEKYCRVGEATGQVNFTLDN
jgi:hypothetical protein